MKLVSALSKEELRKFKLLLKQQKASNDEFLVAKLLDAYKYNKNEDDNTIRLKVFPSKNKNAFYQLKNRMVETVFKSLILLNYKKDEKILIKNYLTLAEVFVYKSEYELAFDILEKAERKANKKKYYSLLNIIYNDIIDLSISYSKIPLNIYLKKKKDVLKTIEQYEQLEHISLEIAWNLQKSNFRDKGTTILEELDDIKSNIENSDLLSRAPSLKISLQRTIRNALLQKGDFDSLALYLSNTIKEFEKENIFIKTNYNHKIIMQVWLINSLLKLKYFKSVIVESESLMDSLLAYNKLYYNNFIWTYYQSKFIATYYLTNLEDALEFLMHIKNKYAKPKFEYYSLFLNQNMFTVYYSLNNYKKANQYLNELLKPDFFDSLSAELKLSITIVDLIMYFESKDYNYLIYKIKEIKRKYRTPLSKPNFEREKSFINVLDSLSKYPNPFENEKLLPKLNEFINNSPPFEPGNNENINYKIWLLSRLNKRNYFDELLLEIKPD